MYKLRTTRITATGEIVVQGQVFTASIAEDGRIRIVYADRTVTVTESMVKTERPPHKD
jgi:hypothetical protein